MTRELLDLARSIAITAGELAARRRLEGAEIAESKSSPEDIVTHADREVEQLVRELLAKARPLDGFVGEESGADAGSSGLSWIVDPIDGTVNYFYGVPHYAVSIAVVEGGQDPASWTALAGAVVNPAIGEVFTASAGEGAFLGDRRLRVKETPLSLALVATGFSYSAVRRREQAAVVTGLVGEIRDIRRTGTASLDLCAVACGRADAYYETGLKPWDHAAGALVAREAGATVSGLDGRAGDGVFLLAAAPELARTLEDRLVALGVAR